MKYFLCYIYNYGHYPIVRIPNTHTDLCSVENISWWGK